MDYELAEQLKNAGFPQGDVKNHNYFLSPEKEVIIVPTIEELAKEWLKLKK